VDHTAPANRPRLFIAWDSTLKAVEQTMKVLRDFPPADLAVDIEIIGGVDAASFGVLRDKLDAGIRQSDALLAVVDKPNANMGLELGMALARGLPVALAAEGDVVAVWTRGTPLSGLLQETNASDEVRAIRLMSSQAQWQPVVSERITGERKLALIPTGGAGYGRIVAQMLGPQGWEVLTLDDWQLPDLAQRLAGVERLAWVLLPLKTTCVRHGRENAAASVVFGYAAELGIEVAVFGCDGVPELADAIPWTKKAFAGPIELPERILAWSSEVDQKLGRAPRVTVDVLDHWRRHMHSLHAHPVRWARARLRDALDVLPIALTLTEGEGVERLDGGAARAGDRHRGTLIALVQQLREEPTAPRLIVVAEPGAGKTTLLRHAASQLARPDHDAVPVFVSLAELEEAHDPLELAARGLGELGVDEVLILRALGRAAEAGRLWLFLDGFDEVKNHARMRQRITGWATSDAMRQAVIVVTSRPVAVDPTVWPEFRQARVDYLDERERHELVSRLLGAERAMAFDAHAARIAGFAVLGRNPFLLTLAALLTARAWEEERKQDAPLSRVTLLEQAIDDCLRRGWGAQAESDGQGSGGVRSPVAARQVLGPLSLVLQRQGRESWKREEVEAALLVARAEFPVVRQHIGASGIWDGDPAFLDDVRLRAGLLGPLLGAGSRWEYLHRSFRELLAAEGLLAIAGNVPRERAARLLFEDEAKRRQGVKDPPPAAAR
jgi:NACHT domain